MAVADSSRSGSSCSALTGFRRGLLTGALSLAGLIAGAVVGARLAPGLLGRARRVTSRWSRSPGR